MKTYFVYIMTNKGNRILYTGVTNDLRRRVYEHKSGKNPKAFCTKYRCLKLVWYVHTNSIEAAIEEEKRIKKGSRKKKIALIEAMNPEWKDLSEEL